MLYVIINPYGYIYKLTNTLNNKIYIGQTKNIIRRRNEYKTRNVNDNRRYNYGIVREINKVGFDKFTFEVIDHAFTANKLDELEKFYIQTLNTTNPDIGHNSRSGNLHEPLNNETRKKMSEAHKGLTESSITKKKKSKSIIAFYDDEVIIADSGKLFADYIGSSKDMVSHAISKGMKIHGYYVFRLMEEKDLSDKYKQLKDKKYYQYYTIVKEGVETIEKSYNVKYLRYD